MNQIIESFVVDASVATKWHLRDEQNADKALLMIIRFREGRTDLWAPYHIRYEVSSAITRATRGRGQRISSIVGRQEIEAFLALGIKTVYDDSVVFDAYTLAHQYNCGFYDALYLALALQLSVPLVTADESFYRAIQGHPSVIWIGDYSPPDDN